jgi:hypothetical protein
MGGRRWREDERGQSLILILVAMATVIIITAFAIDVARWYQKRHQAQVAADAAALAAANCLSTQTCTNPSAAGDAGVLASNYANTNSVPLSAVSFDSANKLVTVTTATTQKGAISSVTGNIQASAVASWAGGPLALSFFSANEGCGTGSASGEPLGLFIDQNGGGNTSVSGMHANGEYYNANDSGSATYNGTVSGNTGNGSSTGAYSCNGGVNTSCKRKDAGSATGDCWENKSNINVNSSGNSYLPYPVCYNLPGSTSTPQPNPPGCTNSSIGGGSTVTCQFPTNGYWTTDTSAPAGDQITGPGVYCIGSAGNISTSYSGSPACNTITSTSHAVGSIYVDATILSNLNGYEFVGPCVFLNAAKGTMSGPASNPLIYGTSNTTTSGTIDVSIVTPNSQSTTLNGTVYDPSGSVQFTGNNAFIGFVESQNIWVNGNNSVTGNGPSSPNQPGSDTLTQ